METIVTIITIIITVFAFLQIILFFKLWGMTNDVNAIKNDLKKNDYVVDAKTAFLNGQKQIAQEILDKGLIAIDEEMKVNSYSSEPKIRKQQIIETINYLGLKLPQYNGNKYNVGDLVIWIAKDQQMRIKSITIDGQYSCFINEGNTFIGDFTESELKLVE